MTQPISFFAQGIPKGQPRPRAFARNIGGQWTARVYDAGTAEGWKSCIADAARKGNIPIRPLTGPIKLSLLFTMPRLASHFKRTGEVKPGAPFWHVVRYDLDNLDKAVLDALTVLGFWKDDSQIAELESSKVYGDVPGCRIVIQELDDLKEKLSSISYAGRKQAELLDLA